MTLDSSKNFYITTTLPYVNADPHIGFALEIIQADAIARYQRMLGKNVIFNTGTDEHGLKIHRKAQERGISTQTYCDEYASKFGALKDALNLSYTHFIRTTDPHHKKAAQTFWEKCKENGDIYKKAYEVKYCVGCEMEKTDSELEDGKCPLHKNYEIEHISEENYFFRFSAYAQPLLDLYHTHEKFIIPKHRLVEIRTFVENGLEDFSISRLKEKMPWGVPVPGDEEHVMYVWFDALINYISTLGWPENIENFSAYWPGLQVAGKDNLRQQSAMWQAMLFSAGLPASSHIFIHGFITSEGQKMSKSLGNVVSPYDIVEEYGTDAVRFYLLGALPSFDDGDFAQERFEEFYTAHLVNGIGNLTSRILTMIEKYHTGKVPKRAPDIFDTEIFWKQYTEYIEEFDFAKMVEVVNALVAKLDKAISDEKPWEKAKTGEDISEFLYQLVEGLRHIALAISPIIPQSADKIFENLHIQEIKTLDEEKQWGRLEPDTDISKGEILFRRLEK